jgi:hypothetical protein
MECCLAAVSNSQEEIPMTMLRQRMTEDMRIRNLSLHTQASYLQQVSQFARHFGKSPDKLGTEDVRAYHLLSNEGTDARYKLDPYRYCRPSLFLQDYAQA